MGLGMNSAVARDLLSGISSGLDAMQSSIDTLQGEVATLQSRWDGDAREAFSEAILQAETSLASLRLMATHATLHALESIDALQEFDRRRESVWKR